jgi:CHAT domain-containing protein
MACAAAFCLTPLVALSSEMPPRGARTEVIGRMFAAWAAGDAAGLEHNWVSPNAAYQAMRSEIIVRSRLQCVDIRGIRVIDAVTDGDTDVLIVDLHIEETWLATGRVNAGRVVRWRVVLRPYGSEWKVEAAKPLGAYAAARVIALSGVERAGFLRQHSDWIDGAFVLSLLSAVDDLRRAARFAEAADLVQIAEASALDLGSLGHEARVHGAKADLLQAAGDVAGAMAEAERSLELAQAAGDKDAQLLAYYYLTRISKDSGLIERATSLALKGIALGNESTELVALSRLHLMIAVERSWTGDLVSVAQSIQEVERVSAISGDPWGAARISFALAVLQWAQKDYGLALRAIRQGTEFARQQSAWTIVAGGLISQGAILDDAGEYQESVRVLREACRLARSRNDVDNESRCQTHMAIVRLKVDPPPADKEIVVMGERTRRQGEQYGPFLASLAELRIRQRRFREALDAAAEAERYFRDNTPDRPRAAKAIALQASVRRSMNRPRDAIALLLRAVALLESSHNDAGGSERQQRLGFEEAARVYDQLAVLYVEQGRPMDALLATERGRARTLLQMIEEMQGWLPRDLSAEELAAVSALEERIASLNRRMTEPAANKAALGEALDQARAELEMLRGRLFTLRRDPEAPPPVAPSVTRDALSALPDGIAFVEYVAAFGDVYALVVRNAAGAVRVTATKLPGSQKKIMAAAHEVTRRIVDRDLRYAAVSRNAYQLLLHPLAAELRHANSLCLLPTAELWNLPFAALQDERSRFVAERYAVFYEPSIFAFLHSRGGSPRKFETLFAVGNPEVRSGAYEVLADAYSSVKLQPLPDAEQEVKTIGGFYERAVVVTGSQATEERVRQNLRGFDVLHFAVHAMYDQRNPMYSRLVLGSSRPDVDGYLEAHEVIALAPRASLVVLSACESARGDHDVAEGLVGLAWSFLATGSRAVVASQWKVESQATARIMIELHRALRRGERAGAALRRAQLALIRDPDYHHPFYWSPFVLLGAP